MNASSSISILVDPASSKSATLGAFVELHRVGVSTPDAASSSEGESEERPLSQSSSSAEAVAAVPPLNKSSILCSSRCTPPAWASKLVARYRSFVESVLSHPSVKPLLYVWSIIHKVFTFNFLGKKCPFDLLPTEMWGFIKFFGVTVAIFYLGWHLFRESSVIPLEYDSDYRLSDFTVFEIQPILSDTILYYAFGQMYLPDSFVGADTLAWITLTICSVSPTQPNQQPPKRSPP